MGLCKSIPWLKFRQILEENRVNGHGAAQIVAHSQRATTDLCGDTSSTAQLHPQQLALASGVQPPLTLVHRAIGECVLRRFSKPQQLPSG